jgi:hypothetical protein
MNLQNTYLILDRTSKGMMAQNVNQKPGLKLESGTNPQLKSSIKPKLKLGINPQLKSGLKPRLYV